MCLILMVSAFLTGCETDRAAIRATEKAKAERDAVAQAVAIASQQVELPEQPEACRERITAGVNGKTRADVALVKFDAALGRSNDLREQCAGWYDNVRAGHRRGTRSGERHAKPL